MSGLEDEKLIKKSKATQKLKYANAIVDYFEYFCQISSESILIILSYTVSKFAHFLRHSVFIEAGNVEIMSPPSPLSPPSILSTDIVPVTIFLCCIVSCRVSVLKLQCYYATLFPPQMLPVVRREFFND